MHARSLLYSSKLYWCAANCASFWRICHIALDLVTLHKFANSIIYFLISTENGAVNGVHDDFQAVVQFYFEYDFSIFSFQLDSHSFRSVSCFRSRLGLVGGYAGLIWGDIGFIGLVGFIAIIVLYVTRLTGVIIFTGITILGVIIGLVFGIVFNVIIVGAGRVLLGGRCRID
jgi:hypothetical protein